MTRHLLKLLTAFALSGVAAISMASDSGFIVDELRAVHSQLTDARRWVDSDIRANLSHRWKSAPRRLTDSGLRFAESELEALPWVTDVDLHRITRNGNFLAGFGVSGVGLLWTGESHALGFQPSGEWTDGSGDDFASFGVFGRKAVGDWGVIGANVFGDYASDSELGEFSRWSLGADFQSELADLRGNWYAEGAGFRSRRIRNGEVFAYSPSGVDAELNLRWRGVSEWTGFAEYEKWDGRFGDADTQDVGFGVTYRPLGGGLLAGLEVDAGYFTAAGADDRLDLRFAYSRVLGGDNRVTRRDFGFGVQSALVAPVERERKIEIAEATVLDPEFVIADPRVLRQRDGMWIGDNRPFMLNVKSRCTLVFAYPQTAYEQETSAELHEQAENPAKFDDLCDTINKTANIRTTDSNGNLATHRAVSGTALDNLKLLIIAGIRATATNTAGKTPLDLAQRKHSATTDSELRETLSTIAMVIRASGGECAAESGTLCTIDYDALYEDGGNFDFFIVDDVVLPSNFQGDDIYQLHHPEYGKMTLHSTRPWQWDSRITVTPDGMVRVKDGAILKARDFQLQEIYASNEHLPYPALVRLKVDISVMSHPQPWTIPPIRKVTPNYTGAYFTVTATAPNAQLGYSFGPGGRAAYRLLHTSSSHVESVRDGYSIYDHADVMFTHDLRSYVSYGASFFTEIEAARWLHSEVRLTTANQRLAATYYDGAFAVSLNQAIGQGGPEVHAVHMFVDPYEFRNELQTLNFTIATPSIPSHTSKRVGAGHLGAVVTLSDDGLRNPNYAIIAHDDALTIDQTGILRLANTVSIGRKATLVAKITSPDLLGVLTVTAEVVSRCTPADVTPLIPSRNNHREYSEYQKKGDLLLNAAEHGDIAEICRLISQRADPNYRVGGDGAFPLSFGALNGDAEIARVLIAHDADSSFAYRYGETAMHYAARGFHFEYAQVLHQDGASTIDKRFNGDQPIHWIPDRSDKTKAQYRAFFDLLLSDEEANVNEQGRLGETSLIKAARSGNLNWAGALIDLEADIHVIANNRDTACSVSIRNEDMQKLLECTPSTDNDG